MTDTRQALLPCPFCGNSKGLAVANENPQDLSGGYFIACPSCDASTGLRFACGEDPIPLLIEQWNRRAALSAQPVAGAVATDETGWLIEHSGEILPGAEQRAQVSWLRVQMKFNGYGAREFGLTHDANEALRFSRREDAEAVLAMHLGARPPDWYSNPFSVTEHMWPAAPQAQAAPAPEPSAQLTWENPPSAIEGRLSVWLTSGSELHSRTVNLVVRFARALASKLAAAEAKYGYSDGWASPAWMDECRAKLMEHIAKGDPRDVAAYCAFLWHHGASTAQPEPSDESECEHATIRYMLDAAQPEPSTQGRPCPFGCTTQEEHDAHQSAEPSAQGEPVAWRPGDPIYDDAYVRGVAVGFAEDDSRRTTLLRIADRIEARASAPSTSPPAVVEAVPIPDCTVADVGFRWDMEAQRHVPQVLVEFEPTPPNSPVDAKGWKDRNAFAALVKSRGIAPKAAQP